MAPTTSAATAEALRLLDLADPLIAEALALLPPAELARARRLSKRCNEVHVPQAELVARQRVEATVRARGWSTVAAGYSHSLHVRRNDGNDTGKVFSWGAGGIFRQLDLLGQGQADGPPVSVPTPMAGLGGVTVREVAAGKHHTLLLGSCGGVWSCGDGWYGKLGHGDSAHHATPRRIDGLAQVRAVQVAAAGRDHSLVLSAAGHVYSFGCGDEGVLGHGDRENQLLPRRIAALRHTRICQVSCGETHSLAVGEEGELYAWGWGEFGQLGLGEGPHRDQLVPARVALPAGVRIRQASGGSRGSLAVATDGALYAWGMGGYLGLGDEEYRYVPTLVEALAETPVRSAAAGCYHSIVLTEAGGVLTFGHDTGGWLLGCGDEGLVKVQRLVPKAVAALAGKEVVQVAAGNEHTVVQLAGGEVWTFGLNQCGQLGIGKSGEAAAGTAEPTKVKGLERLACDANDALIVATISKAESGYGLNLTSRGECLLIAGVDEGSSADEAGLHAGLRIEAITSPVGAFAPRQAATGLSLRETVELLSAHARVTLHCTPATEAELGAGASTCDEAERTPVCELRPALTAEEVEEVHALARRFGGAPHVYQPSPRGDEAGLHEALFLHAGGYFAREAPSLCAKLLGLMTERSCLAHDGAPNPNPNPNRAHAVRCIEYHTYRAGGGLLDPQHRDVGSNLTLSVLLSRPEEVSGGRFVTYERGDGGGDGGGGSGGGGGGGGDGGSGRGVAVPHELASGDGVLFASERVHHVEEVEAGTRHSLVIELWDAARGDNRADRHG